MTLKGRGARAARRSGKVRRAEAREGKATADVPAAPCRFADDGRDYRIVTGGEEPVPRTLIATLWDASFVVSGSRVTVNP